MSPIRRVPLADVLPLRRAILRPMQTEADCVFEGDELPGAVHLAVGEPTIGIASVVPTAHPAGPKGEWRIRMVGVVEDRRGEGIGEALVDECVARAGAGGATAVWLSARLHLEAWYEGLGFASFGGVYEKPPVGPHIDMRREIPA